MEARSASEIPTGPVWQHEPQLGWSSLHCGTAAAINPPGAFGAETLYELASLGVIVRQRTFKEWHRCRANACAVHPLE